MGTIGEKHVFVLCIDNVSKDNLGYLRGCFIVLKSCIKTKHLSNQKHNFFIINKRIKKKNMAKLIKMV